MNRRIVSHFWCSATGGRSYFPRDFDKNPKYSTDNRYLCFPSTSIVMVPDRRPGEPRPTKVALTNCPFSSRASVVVISVEFETETLLILNGPLSSDPVETMCIV